jgi:hypothetical protein
MEAENPLPHIERVVVVGAYERLIEVVERAMRQEHSIELLRLRVPVAPADRALATDQNFQREHGVVAAIVGKGERERVLRQLVDGAVEVPEIEITASPLRGVQVRRRIVARAVEADEDRGKLG